MSQARISSTNSHVDCFQPNNPSQAEAYLFLHSFPGIQGKNEDIAQAVSHNTGRNAYVIHYAGLGLAKDKTFNFIKSVEESIEVTRSLLEKYEKLHLVGHSWGGLISLNIFNSFLKPEQRGQLILLAPFTEFPRDGSVESWLIPMASKKDVVHFSYKSPEEVRNDFFSVEKKYDPRKNLVHLKLQDKQVALIEAIDDPDVPNRSTASLYQLLSQQGDIQLIRLEDDHCFTKNRKNIIDSTLTVIDTYMQNLNLIVIQSHSDAEKSKKANPSIDSWRRRNP